jgi:hypothetical protein
MRGTTHLTTILGLTLTALAWACSDPADDGPSPSGGAAGSEGGSAGTAGTAGLGGSAGTSPTEEIVGAEELAGLAFELSIPEVPSPTGKPWCLGACRPATMVVTAASVPTLQAVWGRTGYAQPFSLTREGGRWTLDDSILLGTHHEPHAMCRHQSELRRATFTFTRRSGESGVRLTIDGNQRSQNCDDDFEMDYEFDLVITGVPDRRPATVALSSRIQDSLEDVVVELDKPLTEGASAFLEPSQGGPVLPLEPIANDGWVVGFSTSKVFPIPTTYLMHFNGIDMGGVGTPSPVEIRTLSDFGVFPKDGFESGHMLGIRWDASFQSPAIVDSYVDAIDAISGERMLLIPRGVRTMMRLQRAPEHTGVSMNLRIVNNCPVSDPIGSVRVTWAVMGSDHREVQSVKALETSVWEIPYALEVGEVQRLELPLTGSGDSILVALKGDSYEGSGCRSVTTLVDDVVTEILP